MKKVFYLSLFLLVFAFAGLREECGTSTLSNGGIILLRGWSTYLSPVNGPACGFRPSCSGYSREAVRKYGAVKGVIMTSDRLQRCNACRNPALYPVTPEGYSYDSVSANVNR